MTITVVGVLTGELRKYPDGTAVPLPSYGAHTIINGGAGTAAISIMGQSFTIAAGAVATFSGHEIASTSGAAVHSTLRSGSFGRN